MYKEQLRELLECVVEIKDQLYEVKVYENEDWDDVEEYTQLPVKGRHIRMFFASKWYRCNFQNNWIIHIFKWTEDWRIIQSDDSRDFSEQNVKVYEELIEIIKFI